MYGLRDGFWSCLFVGAALASLSRAAPEWNAPHAPTPLPPPMPAPSEATPLAGKFTSAICLYVCMYVCDPLSPIRLIESEQRVQCETLSCQRTLSKLLHCCDQYALVLVLQ
jgi:hypothetical protein